MRTFLPLLLLCSPLAAGQEAAITPGEPEPGIEAPEPEFRKARLFVNQVIEQDAGRTLGFGIGFSIAPVKAAEQRAVETFLAEYEGSDAVLAAAQQVDVDVVRSMDTEQLKQTLKGVSGLTEADKDSIDKVFEAVGGDTTLAADLIEIMQSGETAITFTLEPFLELDFKSVDMRLTIPLAGFSSGAGTDFAFGNIGLDVHGGGGWGGEFAFGITGGLEYWIPSGMTRSNAAAVSNLAASPRYLHEYTTVVPYLVFAGDLAWVQLQASLAYDMSFGVRGSPKDDQFHYLHWGTSLAVTAIPYVVISAEVTGLVPTVNGASFDATFLTSGLRFVASWMDIGVAFQVPLVEKDDSEVSGATGVSFGSPSKFNAMITALFGW